MPGTFIVIDGVDGSGKATQTQKEVERLRAQGLRVEIIDFPRYKDNFMGKLIGECLRGEYGDFIAIHPKIASVLYAVDRFESSAQINKWLAEGAIVIADRYVSSNQIHQAGKISNDVERKEFLKWLDTLEFDICKIPRPDLIIYLDLSVDTVTKLLKEKNLSAKKEYLQGGADQAENDIAHLIASRESGMKLLMEMDNWTRIQCEEGDKLRSIDSIHEEIHKTLIKVLKQP